MAEKTTDEFHGLGGAYVIKDGKRVREEDATAPKAPPPQPSPAEKSEGGSNDNVVELSTRKPK